MQVNLVHVDRSYFWEIETWFSCLIHPSFPMKNCLCLHEPHLTISFSHDSTKKQTYSPHSFASFSSFPLQKKKKKKGEKKRKQFLATEQSCQLSPYKETGINLQFLACHLEFYACQDLKKRLWVLSTGVLSSSMSAVTRYYYSVSGLDFCSQSILTTCL